jgi:hypothetical protein
LRHFESERAGSSVLKKAFQLENTFEKAQQLFITYLKLDRPEEALPYLRYASANNTSTFNLNELQTFVEHLIELKKQYAKRHKQCDSEQSTGRWLS